MGTLKRLLVVLTALLGVGLVGAAGALLAEGTDFSVKLANGGAPAKVVRPVGDVKSGEPAVHVLDPLLVVNKDGSAALGAHLQSVTDVDVSLVGVAIWVDRHRVSVNSTEMWLPVLAGERSQVGAASDAGGFVVPNGIGEATRADVEFRFDDGTCVLADVTAVARTNEHRSIYPKSNRPIGPVTSDDPPLGSTPCKSERGSNTKTKQAQDELADAVNRKADSLTKRHELRVTIREQSPYDAYQPAERAGECVRATVAPSQLVVEDNSKELPTVLADPEIPPTARLTADGACEVVLIVNVPHVSSYRFGVAIMGRGISQPTDPGATTATAGASPQAVEVPR